VASRIPIDPHYRAMLERRTRLLTQHAFRTFVNQLDETLGQL